MTQFVPLKMDTSSDEYREWSRDHKKEGNSIPILYVVRADGKMLYGKSGSLNGDALPTMLVAALNQSGKILPYKQAQLAEETYQKFYSLREGGDDAGAIKALSKIKKLGTPGSIESFAEPISKINQEVQVMANDVREKLAGILEQLESSDTDKHVESLLQWFQIKRDYSALRLCKTDLATFSRKLSKLSDLKPLVTQIKIIDAARVSKSKSSKLRSLEKLAKLIETSEIDSVKEQAKLESDNLQASIKD